jgi:hypothetical protein
MKRDRYFYSITSFVMLVLLVTGFRRFYLEGKESDGAGIPHSILVLVIVHGIALTIWVALFFVQAVLIAARKRLLHMKLGWATAADALVVVVTGPLVAIAAPRLRPQAHLFGMSYRQFMLPMFTEIIAFAAFVALGIYFRKKPAIHRSMMLLATLSVISGATSRTDSIHALFRGGIGWVTIFGPVFALAAIILVARTVTTRSFDRSFALGLAGLALIYVSAMYLAVGDAWSRVAERIAQG